MGSENPLVLRIEYLENDGKLFWQANNNPIGTKIHAVCGEKKCFEILFLLIYLIQLVKFFSRCFTVFLSPQFRESEAFIFNTALYYRKIFILFVCALIFKIFLIF